MSASPLRPFVWSAALWLPACFTLWAVFSSVLVWPVAQLLDLMLPALLPHAISAVEQHGVALEIVTRLQTPAEPGQRVGVLVLTGTPLIYAWCMALYAGLVMATPLEDGGRLRQLAIGLPILFLVVLWGASFNVLKQLSFDSGLLGAASTQRAGLHPDLIALGYQFGYLILPPVAPIVLWVTQNRRFIEYLVGWNGEPRTVPGGQTDTVELSSTTSSSSEQDSR